MADARAFPATSPDLLSGLIAGRFLITERLGKGGMGEVYRAQDTKLKRTVALKRMAPQLRSDAMYRRRFQAEAERVSGFTDAHVAALYDVVEDRDEMFLVMEFVQGETLRERLRRPMSLEEFFQVAVQCAEGLGRAHEHRIVHCDIKPENIMLTPDGQVKILDFGVAKYLPRPDQSTTADRATTVAGTPSYMAPEVLLEKSPDGRADIFSLGIVFYECLTRTHPFLAGSFLATADRIRSETPAPIRIFNSAAPEGLQKVVSKTLAKDPEERYAIAGELLQDLRMVEAGLTPSSLHSLLPQVLRRAKSRLWIWYAVAAVLVAAAVFAAYHRAHGSPVLAERGWVLITDLDSRGGHDISSEAVREGLTIALQQSRYVNVFPRTRAFEVLRRMEKANAPQINEDLGREICRREGLQVLLTGTVEQIGHSFQISVQAVDPVRGNLLVAENEHFNRADDFFDKTDELAKRLRKDLGESLGGIEKNSKPLAKVTTRSLEALQLYSQATDAMASGQNDQVAALLQSALKLDPDFAMAHLRLAQFYASLVGRNQQAFRELQQAYSLRQNVSDREQRRIEANYFDYQEQYEEAAQSLNVLLSLYPDDVEAHEELASAYDGAGKPDKVIGELREIVRLEPSSSQAYAGLALQLSFQNAFNEALAVTRQAQIRGLDSPRLHWGMGMAYFGQGNLAAARDQFRQVQAGGGEFESLGQLLLARVDIYEGRLGLARTELEAGIRKEQLEHTKGLQLPRRDLLGDVALVMGDSRLAREQADQISAAPPDDLQTVDHAAAGTLYARSGNIAAARRQLELLEKIRSSAPSAWNRCNYLLVSGEVALAEKRPEEATADFRNAAAAFPGAAPHIGLARAYAMQRDWQAAVDEWERVLNSRGQLLRDMFPGTVALAHFQIAQAYHQLGNYSAAQQQYQQFLNVWRNGDDVPLRREAASELKTLERQKQ